MLLILLIFFLSAGSLSLLFWVGTLFLQSYLYTQPSQNLYWQAPVAGVILAGYITTWCALILYYPTADPNNIPYDTIFRFNIIEDMVKDKKPVKELKVIPKKGEPLIFKRHSVPPPPGVLHKWKYQNDSDKPWPGNAQAILLTHEGEEFRFAPVNPGDDRFFSDKGGWYLDVDGNGTDGKPQARRFGRFVSNVSINLVFLALWIGAMFLVRFLVGHGLLIGVLLWLVITLTLMPMLLSYSAETSQKRRIGTVRTVGQTNAPALVHGSQLRM